MNKPILYILSGCPGCGKSYWSAQFIQNRNDIEYVSRDDIRFSLLEDDDDYFAREEEVFVKFVAAIRYALYNKHDCIADATHLNRKSRKKLIRAIDHLGQLEYQIIFVYFNIPLEVCKERNAQREGRRYVPEDTIEAMYSNIQEPSAAEDNRCVGLILMGV